MKPQRDEDVVAQPAALDHRQADAGEATLFGRPPSDLQARRQVGVMLQQAQLPESAELEAELAAKDVSFSPRYAEQDPAWLEVTEEPAGDPGLTEMPTQ